MGVDRRLLQSVRDTIRQGFSWATREGPLCEEPIRNGRFKIMEVTLATEAIFRGGWPDHPHFPTRLLFFVPDGFSTTYGARLLLLHDWTCRPRHISLHCTRSSPRARPL